MTPAAPARRGSPGGLGGLTLVAAAAVLAVNLAGIWAIAVARRGVLDEAERLLRLETAARARQLDSIVASTRADLAFLAASPALNQVQADLFSPDPRTAGWRQRAVESSLLIFMRGHPEVGRLLLVDGDGTILVTGVRRGGVPVVFLGAGADPPRAAARRELRGLVTIAGGAAVESVRLDAAIDAASLLDARGGDSDSRRCAVSDRDGRLAGPPRPDGDSIRAAAALAVDGWSATAPWSIVCEQPTAAALDLVRPIAERYRLTLGLNLAVMVLAAALGVVAIVQHRRRGQLEERARESERVRELERQLFHAERLATAGRLAAGIAHEINNPLEGMANYLHLARDAAARGDADAVGRRLAKVDEGLRSVAGIVSRVLAHADPSAPPLVPLDAAEVVARSVEWVRSRREFGSIAFASRIAGPLPVVGNETQLGQVMLNLLLNACEVQGDGGEVLVSAGLDGDAVLIEVADRGPGVTPEDAVRIFEPFVSTKNSTGLGLSVCYGIVEQHGGVIEAAPRDGGGAVFRVRLPRRYEEAGS